MVRYTTILALVQSALVSSTSTPATTYDYIIIGAGPAGLVAANRLSANPDISVVVIEAGDSQLNNPNVTRIPRTIAEFSPGLNTQVDWQYQSAPQKYTNDRVLTLPQGKALGGSTVINGMTYVRAEKEQIDAWEELGNDGWNWDALWPYYISQENFTSPDAEQVENGASFDEQAHGRKGEMDVAFSPYLMGQGAAEIFAQTAEKLGIRRNGEVNSGRMAGSSVWPMSVDTREGVREDAARSFYWPIEQKRQNLETWLNTTVTRIVWKEGKKGTYGDQKIRALGVEVVSSQGELQIVQAKKEVLLAAGSLRSPALLQQSGIGHSSLLSALDVEQKVDLPAVGANFQDQPANGIAYTSTTNWAGYATFATYLTASQLFGDELESIVQEVKENVTKYAQRIIRDYPDNTTTIAVQEKLIKHQINLHLTPNSTTPITEILWFPYETVIAAQFWQLLPFSRGTVTATRSRNSTQDGTGKFGIPRINQNFLQIDLDILVQARTATFVRHMFSTQPLSGLVSGEASPGFSTIPQNATYRDEAWHEWIKANYQTNSHPVASCSMLPREMGGVVDTRGKVYGTGNVRVLDASGWAGQVSGHLTSTVQAVAGRLVDLMVEESRYEASEGSRPKKMCFVLENT